MRIVMQFGARERMTPQVGPIEHEHQGVGVVVGDQFGGQRMAITIHAGAHEVMLALRDERAHAGEQRSICRIVLENLPQQGGVGFEHIGHHVER